MAKAEVVTGPPVVQLTLSVDEANVLYEIICSVESNFESQKTPRERLYDAICDQLSDIELGDDTGLECQCDVSGSLRFKAAP